VDDLRLIRFWLRELFSVHFTFGIVNAPFLNLAFIDVIFPKIKEKEAIHLSLGTFRTDNHLRNGMLPGLCALARFRHLHCYPFQLNDALFNELVTSKHSISKVSSSWCSPDSIGNFIKVCNNIFVAF
jgi:hypothetical protein